MRSLPVIVILLALVVCGFSQGWVGQQLVNRPNKDTCDLYPVMAFDAAGRPWVVWSKNLCDSTLVYSRWDGDRWTPQHGVGADAPGVDSRLRASLCFDASGRAWLTWTNLKLDNSLDVASCFWTDSGWSPEAQVNTPDADSFNAVSQIAYGGGQLWCVWSGGPNGSSNLSVFASRWDDATGAWGPEMQVSPPDGNLHWFTDLAVDSTGTPHVVWCTHPLYTVFYSHFDGHEWVSPIPVNDREHVTASAWAGPRIEIDHTGTMHVCFTGAKAGAMHSDIFYSRNDGAGWSPCQMVTRDSIYDEWYSDMAADSRDNVWIAWERYDEGTDYFRIYAARFDGRSWSTEQRLDNDSAYYDVSAAVALDTAGLPWVVWHAMTCGAGNDDIYFNRYLIPGALDEAASYPTATGHLSLHALMTTGRARFCYTLPTAGLARMDIYDRLGRSVSVIAESRSAAGQYSTEWNGHTLDGKSAPTGTYVCRLQAVGMNATCSFVLLPH
jgi:hypothetical protein